MIYDRSYAYEYSGLSPFLRSVTPIRAYYDMFAVFLFPEETEKKTTTTKGNRHFLDLFSIKSSDKFTSPAPPRQ